MYNVRLWSVLVTLDRSLSTEKKINDYQSNVDHKSCNTTVEGKRFQELLIIFHISAVLMTTGMTYQLLHSPLTARNSCIVSFQ